MAPRGPGDGPGQRDAAGARPVAYRGVWPGLGLLLGARGEVVETQTARADRGLNHLAAVRAFYLDLAQWAMDDPARWGVWAAPCPIREEEMSRRTEKAPVSWLRHQPQCSG